MGLSLYNVQDPHGRYIVLYSYTLLMFTMYRPVLTVYSAVQLHFINLYNVQDPYGRYIVLYSYTLLMFTMYRPELTVYSAVQLHFINITIYRTRTEGI